MTLSDQRYIEAEGNVLVVWGGNRIFGTRMTYDLDEERGVIENAIGNVEAEFLFWARQVEKIGENKIRLKSANVTTCTQPVPYWSFAVSSATITIDSYARMRNIRLRAGKMPIFYLPYMVWPVKKDRAAGLLLPEFQSNEERGFAYTQELFVPLGRSADVTLLGRYYTKAGFGWGGQLRFVPNRRGVASLGGFFIRDKVGSLPEVGPGDSRCCRHQPGQRLQLLQRLRARPDARLFADDPGSAGVHTQRQVDQHERARVAQGAAALRRLLSPA
jgi:LPS-assembly protein